MPKQKKKTYKEIMNEILKPKTKDPKPIVVGGGKFEKVVKL